MQYHHRNRLPPPPPPPFGRGGGAGYPRGHRQLYAPPPPHPSMPPAPQRKYEVLMEAGRLAAEYLVSQGVLPPAALQRGTGVWAVPPLPPPPPPPQQQQQQQQQQESPVFYGRRRYEDEYSNNPSARHRRTNGTTSSTSSRDDYSSGSYHGRGKRKYGEYRRGYSDSGRDREKERGRTFFNSRRCEEDEDEDGAPGFRKERRGSRGSDEVRRSVTEAAREEMPSMAQAVEEFGKEVTKSKVVNSIEYVQKDVDVVPEVQDENEEGEVGDDSKVLNSESELVEQATDATDMDTNTGVMELESNQLADGKVPDENAEDSDKISDEAASDDSTLDIEVTNVETPNLLAYCDFAIAPTRPRSVRAHRNAASVSRETSVVATVDLVSSEPASHMVIDESAEQNSLSITKSEKGEVQIFKENSSSGAFSDEPMLLQENGTSVMTDIREEKDDEQLYLVQEYKEETSLSPFTVSHVDSVTQEDSLMQETDLSPLTCHKDGLQQEDSLMPESDLSPVTAHKNSFIEDGNSSPLPISHKDNLIHETDSSQTISSHENNLELQFNDRAQVCDLDTLQQDVDLIEFSDKREIVGADLCPNVGADTAIKMEGRLDQSDSLQVSDLDLVGGTEAAALHHNTTLVQLSAVGPSTGPYEKQLDDLGITADANASATDDFCQLPLENKDVQLDNIECNGPMEVGGFGSPKSKNETICSSMDNIMHPGLHTDVLPGIQDYGLAFSDFLGADIPCYPPMQSDLHAGIGANDSEGIAGMDDSIYGSLPDIGFIDMWGQPTQDYDKFY